MALFGTAEGLIISDPKQLRDELERVKSQLKQRAFEKGFVSKKEVGKVLGKIMTHAVKLAKQIDESEQLEEYP